MSCMSDDQSSSSSNSDVDYQTCDEYEDDEADVPEATSQSSEEGRDWFDYYHTSDEEDEELDILGAAPVVSIRKETRQIHTRSVTGIGHQIQELLHSCEQPKRTRHHGPEVSQDRSTLALATQPNRQRLPSKPEDGEHLTLETRPNRQSVPTRFQDGEPLDIATPHNRQLDMPPVANDENALTTATGIVSTGGYLGTLVQLNVSLTQQRFGDVTVEKATNVNQAFGGNQTISKTATFHEERTDSMSTRADIINKRTVSIAQSWNKGMVKTAALVKAMEKLDVGATWLTIKGNPGEGKTTVGYMALEELHRCGREVFEVRSPEEFSEVISTCPRPVIMLDDVFGNLEFDQTKWSKWESVVSPLLKELEHKSHLNNETHFKDVIVILIGRDYVLNAASVDLGRLSDFLTSERYVICMGRALPRDTEEKRAIWESLSSSSGVFLDTKTVDKILRSVVPHGFPHVCRLFISIFKENKAMAAEEFFRKPLEFLNLSMSKIFKDKYKTQLFKEMLKGDGKANMKRLRELGPSYKLIESGQSLMGSYLRIEADCFVFDHPSIFDCVSFHMCSLDPVFVIEQCQLSFINERVRLQFPKDSTSNSESKLVVFVDKMYADNLAKRFAAEISKQNFLYVLSHQAFTDRSFVNMVMSQITISLSSLLHLNDRNFPFCTEKSFLSLLSSNKAPELLKYIEDRLYLTKDEVDILLYAACKYAASNVLSYLSEKKGPLDINVKFHETMQSPLMIAALTRDANFVNHVLSLHPDVNAADEDERTALHYMCRYGLVAAVRRMIEVGADINVEDRRKHTPLCLACRGNHIELVRLLIDRGAGVDIRTLDTACRGGNIDIVSLLLQTETSLSTPESVQRALLTASAGGNVDVLNLFFQKGASVNVKHCGLPPLHAACMCRQSRAVRWLLEKGAKVDRKSVDGDTAIIKAAERRSSECLNLLLRAGASVNIKDKDERTALHEAARKGSRDCVEMLLESGAIVDVQDIDGNTSLHNAASTGSKECVNVLLKAGAAVNTQNAYGNSSLHRAAWNGSKECVDLLLKEGAAVNKQNKDGDTALHETVAEVGFEECVDKLLKAGAHVDVQNKDGDTALHRAAYWGKIKCVELLLQVGADTTLIDTHGNTAIHEAAGRGSKECVDLLLKTGKTLNTQNNEGNTALHRAAWNGSKECVDLLVKAGAEMAIGDTLGNTALHRAAWKGSIGCVDVLLKFGDSINTQNKYGNTALHRAAWNGSPECIDLLLKAGASVNIQNINNNTALHRAAVRGSEECVGLLLKTGAQVDIQDVYGNSPLHRAAWNGSNGCVELLLKAGAAVAIRDNEGKTALHRATEWKHVDCVHALQNAGAII